jgi:hypothetical protein
MRHISKCPSLHRTRDEEMKDRSTVGSAPPASVPAYTYFQNLVIQAAHFSYPEAFALPGGGADFLHPTVHSSLHPFLSAKTGR